MIGKVVAAAVGFRSGRKLDNAGGNMLRSRLWGELRSCSNLFLPVRRKARPLMGNSLSIVHHLLTNPCLRSSQFTGKRGVSSPGIRPRQSTEHHPHHGFQTLNIEFSMLFLNRAQRAIWTHDRRGQREFGRLASDRKSTITTRREISLVHVWMRGAIFRLERGP